MLGIKSQFLCTLFWLRILRSGTSTLVISLILPFGRLPKTLSARLGFSNVFRPLMAVFKRMKIRTRNLQDSVVVLTVFYIAKYL